MESNLTRNEVLAVARGEDLSEYKKNEGIRKIVRSESEKFIDAPVISWPDIVMNWDVSRESQRFSFDGISVDEFSKNYPYGLCLGYVNLEEFDEKLCHYSRRDDGELWKIGIKSKLAYLIVYLSKGYPISPPVAKPIENDEVIFIGGHHRYAIAKVIGEKRIPIHVCLEHQKEVSDRISVEWR